MYKNRNLNDYFPIYTILKYNYFDNRFKRFGGYHFLQFYNLQRLFDYKTKCYIDFIFYLKSLLRYSTILFVFIVNTQSLITQKLLV